MLTNDSALYAEKQYALKILKSTLSELLQSITECWHKCLDIR